LSVLRTKNRSTAIFRPAKWPNFHALDLGKLKTHVRMGMTCGAKNLFGAILGTVKPEYHFRYPDPMDFARMIVDLDE